jgi:hypothetical protein
VRTGVSHRGVQRHRVILLTNECSTCSNHATTVVSLGGS